MLKNYRKALRVKDESDLGLNRRNKSFTRLSSIKSKTSDQIDHCFLACNVVELRTKKTTKF